MSEQNDNGKKPINWPILGKVTANMVGLEFVFSTAVSIGALIYVDKYLPKQKKKIEEVLSKHVIEPHISLFKPVYNFYNKATAGQQIGQVEIDALNGVQEVDEKEKKKKKEEKFESPINDKEMADKIAKTLVTYSIPAITSTAVIIPAHIFVDRLLGIEQPKTNETTGVNNPYVKIRFKEQMVQLGLTAAINTVGNKPAEGSISLMTKILRKLGVNEDRSKQLSQIMVRYELPNLAALGWAIGQYYKNLANPTQPTSPSL